MPERWSALWWRLKSSAASCVLVANKANTFCQTVVRRTSPASLPPRPPVPTARHQMKNSCHAKTGLFFSPHEKEGVHLENTVIRQQSERSFLHSALFRLFRAKLIRSTSMSACVFGDKEVPTAHWLTELGWLTGLLVYTVKTRPFLAFCPSVFPHFREWGRVNDEESFVTIVPICLLSSSNTSSTTLSIKRPHGHSDPQPNFQWLPAWPRLKSYHFVWGKKQTINNPIYFSFQNKTQIFFLRSLFFPPQFIILHLIWNNKKNIFGLW